MCLLNCVYFRQEIEDLISTSCTEQAGKFPFWMLWSDGAACIPHSHHCGLASPWLAVVAWEMLGALGTSKGSEGAPILQMQASALVTSHRPCHNQLGTP